MPSLADYVNGQKREVKLVVNGKEYVLVPDGRSKRFLKFKEPAHAAGILVKVYIEDNPDADPAAKALEKVDAPQA